MAAARRTFLATAPLAAAATVGGHALAQNQNTPAAPQDPVGSRQAPGFYRFRIGDLEVTAVNDGFAPRPLEGLVRNADLAEVTAAAREAFLPEDAFQNTFTTLVVRHGNRLTLIDTGLGEFGPPTAGTWMANFRAAGFDPAQVNTVIISHFHGDHINGLRRKDGSAVFANAEVMVPAAEWAYWMDDARMSQAPEAMRVGFQGARRVFAPIGDDVKRYEAGKELVSGITAVAAHGHTPGHSAFAISSGKAMLMAVSDITSHPALFVRNPDWAPVFDMDAEQARQTRRRILDMAAAERTRVSFYHAPFPATGFIAKEGDRYRFVPAQWSAGV
jgi:glyoxylase-like metal-dependent hydrolase (beta-lactamase superfamily II)